MTLPKLAGSDTSSLSVNQYRWINFWTAILGQFWTPFPAFFDIRRIYRKRAVAIFPDNARQRAYFYFAFYPAYRYKTPRAAH
ncbi:hypothetical protein CPZ29_26710 [Klebsiella oxytoca]|nr:hypothetical protein CPZ29_26710 [Klebsiella oxytoca]